MLGLSEIHGQTSELVPHTRTSKKVRINICPQTISFRGTAQQNFDLSPVDFYLLDTLNPLFYSAPIENEDTSSTHSFMPVEAFTISPGPLKGRDCCDQTCACVHLRIFRRRTL